MKLSHILIKVNDLDSAVKQWQDKGFTVEYGSAKNPYNALIYFKKGAYIELFKFNGLPKLLKPILRLFGKGKLVDKMNYWQNHPEGFLSVMLENYEDNLDNEIAILKKHGIKGMMLNKSRIDTQGRKLNFKVLFTYNQTLPDIMTYFNIDPKPKTDDIHPNGIKGIKSISIGINPNHHQLLQDLCDDPTLTPFTGTGIKDIIFY